MKIVEIERKPLYHANDVAKLLGVSKATIYNYIKQGKLTGSRAGRNWLFTDEDVNRLLENGRAGQDR